jgi:transcriptional regulator with XRE-family HTH domain
MRIKSLEHLLQLIGNKLAFLRINKGYDTIKDFAAAFGLPQIQYWRLENGRTNPTIGSLYKLMCIHKVNFKDFFSDLDKAKQFLENRVSERNLKSR